MEDFIINKDVAVRGASCRTQRTVLASVIAGAIAVGTLTVSTGVNATPVLEWEQQTTYSFIDNATFRRGPNSNTSNNALAVRWSDHDTTSYIELRYAATTGGPSSPRGQTVDRVKTGGVNGVGRNDPAAIGEAGGLTHENTVISHSYESLASVSVQVDGVLNAIVGGTAVQADTFSFTTDIVFLESDNQGPCLFKDGTRCPDILFALDENLVGSREIVFDGRRYRHTSFVFDQAESSYSAEECNRVPGWNDRGSCVGFVTPETGFRDIDFRFQIEAVPEPSTAALLGLGLLATGFAFGARPRRDAARG